MSLGACRLGTASCHRSGQVQPQVLVLLSSPRLAARAPLHKCHHSAAGGPGRPPVSGAGGSAEAGGGASGGCAGQAAGAAAAVDGCSSVPTCSTAECGGCWTGSRGSSKSAAAPASRLWTSAQHVRTPFRFCQFYPFAEQPITARAAGVTRQAVLASGLLGAAAAGMHRSEGTTTGRRLEPARYTYMRGAVRA